MTSNEQSTTKDSHAHGSEMNRRAMLRKLSGLGVSVPTAAYLTTDKVQASTRDEVTITIAKVWNEDTGSYDDATERVPAAWYKDVQHAHRVHDNAQFYRYPGVSGTTVRPGKMDGSEQAWIEVEVSPKKAKTDSTTVSQAKKQLPAHIDGVPIEFNLSF